MQPRFSAGHETKVKFFYTTCSNNESVGLQAKITLITGTAVALGSSIFLILPLLNSDGSGQMNYLSLILGSDDPAIGTAQAAILPMDAKDTFGILEKTGEGKDNPGTLVIDPESIDPDDNCEFCFRIEYIPSEMDHAGAVLKANKKFDLGDAERMVFFAKGEGGGEEVTFSAAGKHTDKVAGIASEKELMFAFKSEKIKLEKEWQRYEIDLSNADLKDITHGFGFDVAKSKVAGKSVVILIKGITYDSITTTNSLPESQPS